MKIRDSHFFNLQDTLFKYLLLACSLIVVGLFVAIFLMLLNTSWQSIFANGLGFFTGSVWDPIHDVYGALPAIVGTIVAASMATLLALPISLGIAIFFTEYMPTRLRFILSLFIDLLAAIPSVIFGIWGLWIVAPLLKSSIEQPIVGAIGFIPLFSGPAYGLSLFLAVIVLTIMVIPIVSSLTIELISKTPIALKEGMISLGATKWETIKHIALPFARLGIFAAVILGLGRALGETMAVTMVIGNSYSLPFPFGSLFWPSITITSKVASEWYEAAPGIEVSSLIEMALVLLLITVVINVVSRYMIKRISKRGFG
jgi:phosphate transport system permease protein